MTISYVLLFNLILLANQSCVNKNGNPVNWFFAILYPFDSIKQEYVYIDDTSDDLINYKYEEGSFPPQMMAFFDKKRLIRWNTDSSHGFILQTKPNSNAFALDTLDDITNFKVNKPHSFFCISVNDDNAKKLLSSLHLLNIPLIYHKGNKLMDGISFETSVASSTITDEITRIETNNGQIMTLFTKTKLSNSLPYEYLIRKHYKRSFYIKSSKEILLKNICDTERMVLNILSVKYNNKIRFDAKEDRSKWAVSVNNHINCFNDLNFDNESKSVGGITLCFENKKLAQKLREFISKNEECDELKEED